MFLRGVVPVGGDALVSLSLLVEFRESQEKGLVSFLLGGAGGLLSDEEAGGAAAAAAAAPAGAGAGLLEGDSAGGDHGIVGNEFVMLLKDNVLLGGSGSSLSSRLLDSM